MLHVLLPCRQRASATIAVMLARYLNMSKSYFQLWCVFSPSLMKIWLYHTNLRTCRQLWWIMRRPAEQPSAPTNQYPINWAQIWMRNQQAGFLGWLTEVKTQKWDSSEAIWLRTRFRHFAVIGSIASILNITTRGPLAGTRKNFHEWGYLWQWVLIGPGARRRKCVFSNIYGNAEE